MWLPTIDFDTCRSPGGPRTRREALDVCDALQVEPKIALESGPTPDPEGGEDHRAVGRGCDVLAEGLLAGRSLGFPFSACVTPSTIES